MNRDVVTFGILGAAHSLNHSLFLVLPPLLGNIAAGLNVSFQTLGIVATATYFIYGTGALVGGPLSDMLGSVKVARISIGLAGVASLLFLICNDVYTFAAGMFLMALWASFYHPTANKLVAQAFPKSVGNAMGIHNAAGNAGQVLTPTIAFLLGVTFDWRFSFIFFGVLSMITAFFMDRIKVDGDEPTGAKKLEIREFLKVPNLWIILVFNALVGFVFRGVEVYFPTYLRLGEGYTGEFAAIASSLILLFGVAGQLIGGKGSDKFGPAKILVGSIAGVLASLLLLMLVPTSYALVVVFTFAYGVAIFAHQPTMTNLVSRITPRNLMGLSYGVMFFFSFGLGSIAGAVLGWLTDGYGIVFAFWSNVVVAAALLAVTLLIYRTFKDTSPS
jgi:sugar phosphate permease